MHAPCTFVLCILSSTLFHENIVLSCHVSGLLQFVRRDANDLFSGIRVYSAVSYTHLTLPTNSRV